MRTMAAHSVFSYPDAPASDDLPQASAVVALEPEFDFLGLEYRALFARSDATAFQHPLWLDRLYARLAPQRGAEKLVITGRDGGGKLLFVLPMIRRRKWGVTLLEATDLGVSDYAAPVVHPGWRMDPSNRTARAVREQLPGFDLLRIRPVRPEAVNAWRRFFDADALPLDFSAHAVPLFSPHTEWRRQALSASYAKYLDRKKKRLLKSGNVELRLLDAPAEAAGAIRAIQKLRAGRFEGDPIQGEFVREFYAEIAGAGAADGLARTYALSLDGEAIAYVFGLVHAGRFHYLLIGSDYAAHGRHSPGLVAYDLIIEDWLGAGGCCFDFTIGDEPFKRDFGAAATPIYMLSHCATRVGRLAEAAFNLRRRLRGAKTGGELAAGQPERIGGP